jgi:hypothetical protein
MVLRVLSTEQVSRVLCSKSITHLTKHVGYCDAQCARDLKYIDGKANAEGWQASSSDPNAGVGKKGACWYVQSRWLRRIYVDVTAPRWTYGKPTPYPPP